MEEDKKKQVMIGVIVACIILAAGIYWMNHGSSSSSPGFSGPIYMLCTNPDCGKDFEITAKEFRETMQAETPEGVPPSMMGPVGEREMTFRCKFCGEKSAYQAAKCERCGFIFIPDYISKDYSDRCPECGYSRREEMRKKRAREK